MTDKMKLHIEITGEQAEELFAEATDGMLPAARDRIDKNDTLRRIYIRAAIEQRLSQ